MCEVLEQPHRELRFLTKGRKAVQIGAEREGMILTESPLHTGALCMCTDPFNSLDKLVWQGLMWSSFHRRGNEAQRS